jgi:hypothetical protein
VASPPESQPEQAGGFVFFDRRQSVFQHQAAQGVPSCSRSIYFGNSFGFNPGINFSAFL